ncbi:MAG TPA: diacylglycerol kinase family protein, partial [Mariniflexile sp.]
MRHIHFILNPIAGSGNNSLDLALLNKHFNTKDFTIAVKPTSYKKHAVKLTQDSIAENADVIVACGGDGTINEVASCLVNSSIILGIIPIGSGNGLASNLNIPKNLDKALALIKKQTVKKIDVGQLNSHYFFSNTGIGFDAQVIKHYEAANKRTLSSYVKATLKSLRKSNKLIEVETTLNGDIVKQKPFLIFISNSNQMGYNVSLTPKA